MSITKNFRWKARRLSSSIEIASSKIRYESIEADNDLASLAWWCISVADDCIIIGAVQSR